MQREIERRQSRRNLGLGAELGGLGEGAAADAAAMDAAGNDTEEEKQNDDLPPLEDLDEDPPKLANPNFTKWHKPCRDPEPTSSAPTIALSPSRGSSGPVAVAAQPHPANPQAASRRERGTSGDPPPPRERGHFLLFTSEARQYTSTYTEVSERRVRGKRVAHRGKQAQASSRCFTYLLVECVCLLVH